MLQNLTLPDIVCYGVRTGVGVIPYENLPMLSPAPCHEIKANRYALKGEPVIFVVDDESSIRRFICMLLRHLTSALVVDAADPYAALSSAEKMNQPIDLLISDMDLNSPMNGVGLARKLSALNPSMKVLLISGCDDPQARIPSAWKFLAKPFHIEPFLNCIIPLNHSVTRPADYFG